VSLRGLCRLLQKSSLFVLPTKDTEGYAGLKGMVGRLESAFHELSTQYYHQVADQLQLRIEGMNQATQKVLIVRYTTKIGYFNELRQNRQVALSSYQQAYALLKDVNDPGITNHEIKSVAGLLMTKICQLLFQTQSPRDSIKFLREHVAYYGSRSGGKSTPPFIHSTWLAKQYYLFALVFGDAIRRGLQAVQTEHPGFYFFEAAQHTIKRKRFKAAVTAAAIPAGATVAVQPAVYEGQNNLTLEGVADAAAVPKSARERELLALTVLECGTNHSEAIVEMTEQAQEYFKMFNAIRPKGAKASVAAADDATVARRMRMINWLSVCIAREMFEMKQHEKALELVGPAIEMYRQERWDDLLGATLNFSHKCAYIIGNVTTYLQRSIELAGGRAAQSDDVRTEALTNFLAVCNNSSPTACAGEAVNDAWKTIAPADVERTPTLIDMTALLRSVECKVRFARPSVAVNEEIVMLVSFRSWLPGPLPVNKIVPTFEHPSYASPKMQCNGGPTDTPITILPGETTVLTLTFPAAETDGHELRCTSVALQVGESPGAMLTWTVQVSKSSAAKSKADTIASEVETPEEKAEVFRGMAWDALLPAASVELKPMPSLVSVLFEHSGPALVSEQYPLKVRCTSEEKFEMSKVCIRLMLLEGEIPSASGSFHVHGDGDGDGDGDGGKKVKTEFNLEAVLAPGGTTTQDVLISFSKECEATLAVSFEYSTVLSAADPGTVLRRSKEFKEVLNVIKPFNLTAQVTTVQRRPATMLTLNTPYLVSATLACQSPTPIRVVSCEHVPPPHALVEGVDAAVPKAISAENFQQMAGVDVSHQEELCDCGAFSIVGGDTSASGNVELGNLELKWSRSSKTGDGKVYSTIIKLAAAPLSQPPLVVEVVAPSVGHLRQLLPITYIISNYSDYVQDVELTIHPHEAFMYSGSQHATIRILPADIDEDGERAATVCSLHYNLFPLRGGFATLPKLTVKSLKANAEIPVSKGLPRVYIKAFVTTLPA